MIHAVAIFLVRNQKTYLSRRVGTSTYDGHWQNAGGKKEPRESLIRAASRETKEETGLRINCNRFRRLQTLTLRFPTGKPYRVTAFEVTLRPTERPRVMEKKNSRWIGFTSRRIRALRRVVPSIKPTLGLTSLVA